jgi:hypothetical protein
LGLFSKFKQISVPKGEKVVGNLSPLGADGKKMFLFDINSGYTVRDGEWSVVRSPLGNVELLTLT